MSIDVKEKLKIGLKHAAIAVSTEDPKILQESILKALNSLVPISYPEFCVPKASFCIGKMAYFMALRAVASSEKDSFEEAEHYFGKAEKYLRISSSMPDYQKDHIPLRSKEVLAQIYDIEGLGEGKQGHKEALKLRLEAAEAGYALSQVGLAVMYFNGEGTEKSVSKAYEWAIKAWSNREQLDTVYQIKIAKLYKKTKAELEKTPAPSRPVGGLIENNFGFVR